MANYNISYKASFIDIIINSTQLDHTYCKYLSFHEPSKYRVTHDHKFHINVRLHLLLVFRSVRFVIFARFLIDSRFNKIKYLKNQPPKWLSQPPLPCRPLSRLVSGAPRMLNSLTVLLVLGDSGRHVQITTSFSKRGYVIRRGGGGGLDTGWGGFWTGIGMCRKKWE